MKIGMTINMFATLDSILSSLDPSKNFYVGYSGGVDSHVLLHILSRRKLKLKAIYINHGLSPNAEQWAKHCEHICQSLQVPWQTIKVNAQPKAGQSPEAAAREARYRAFADLMQPGDYLLTAHHQDDQAETLLLQLLRGAGVKGLASMPVIKPFAQGYQVRPLLGVNRSEILAYASQNQLQWIEDESNLNTDFDRNFIRQQVMPLLNQRWPVAANTIARSAKHLAEVYEVESWFAENELAKLSGSQPKTLSISELLTYPQAIQKLLLRRWFNVQGLPMPSEAQLERMLTDVLHCREDADPKVVWQHYQLRRYRDDLYALPLITNFDNTVVIPWDLTGEVALPQQLGRLAVKKIQGQGINPKLTAQAQITVRFRQGGERCQPQGRVGSHPLKQLLQEWSVPTWQRNYIPLLYLNDELAAVIGYCICQPFSVAPKETGLVIELA